MHIFFSQVAAFADDPRIGIGVGTPSRIIDLLNAGQLTASAQIESSQETKIFMLIDVGALDSSTIECVIIDCSYIDQKKRGIFDMRETQQPLMQLLNRHELKSRFGGSKEEIHLIMY